MAFFSNLISSVVKTALTPVAVDVVKVVTSQEADTTKELLQSAGEDLDEAIDSIDPT